MAPGIKPNPHWEVNMAPILATSSLFHRLDAAFAARDLARNLDRRDYREVVGRIQATFGPVNVRQGPEGGVSLS